MRRLMYLFMLASIISFMGCEKENQSQEQNQDQNQEEQFSTVNGLFSVAEGRQVRFALGNLVYENGAYSFAEHQYDYGGLFGWGTGSNPTETSTNDHDYPSFDDWGSHIDGGWRTLTYDEWRYVIWNRPNASSKRGAATLCGVHGMILLPDDWQGSGFKADFNGWSTNVYDKKSWAAMVISGAVFLPAAGYRDGSRGENVGDYGCYWAAPSGYDDVAYYIDFYKFDVMDKYYDIRSYGRSVRLVQDNN